MIIGIDKIKAPTGAREAFSEFDRVFTQACSLNYKKHPGPATMSAVGFAIDRFPEVAGSTVVALEKSEAREHLRDMEAAKSKTYYLESRELLIGCIRRIYHEYTCEEPRS